MSKVCCPFPFKLDENMERERWGGGRGREIRAGESGKTKRKVLIPQRSL